MIEKIYSNQIDALLFSVNQYSEDVTNTLKQKINLIIRQNDSSLLSEKLEAFRAENSYIEDIYIVDANSVLSNHKLNDLLSANEEKITRLYNYKKEKYARIEPIEYDGSEYLFFILDKPSKSDLCGLLINPNKFIEDILSPKILSIAQNEFSIFVFNKEKIYDFNFEGNTDPRSLSPQRKLWLLPSYNLAIKLRGETIEDLVARRTQTNLILIIALILLILGGVWLVFKNIKREVDLAQIKSEFVSNVSHELRTPLSLISLFAETLEMDRVKSDEKRKEYYSIISHEALRLSNIVNKILSFSKIEAGKRNFTFAQCDLNSIVDQVSESYKFHLQNNGFEFLVKRNPSPLTISADCEAISEAVINLIDNAMKYSKDIKQVQLTTGEDRNFIFVEVKDKGIGIAKEDQKRIFEKFYRVKSGLIHNTKGTGLGLSLVKQIMDAHKGVVSIESEPEKGSTFRLKFRKID